MTDNSTAFDQAIEKFSATYQKGSARNYDSQVYLAKIDDDYVQPATIEDHCVVEFMNKLITDALFDDSGQQFTLSVSPAVHDINTVLEATRGRYAGNTVHLHAARSGPTGYRAGLELRLKGTRWPMKPMVAPSRYGKNGAVMPAEHEKNIRFYLGMNASPLIVPAVPDLDLDEELGALMQR